MAAINKFNQEINLAIPYLNTHNERLHFDPAHLKVLNEQLEKWQELFSKTQAPETRTSVLVHERQVLFKEFEKQFRQMQQALKHSTVELTEDDYLSLFIHKNKPHPHSRPTPSEVPALAVVERHERQLVLKVFLPESPSLNQRRLPEGVQFVNVLVAWTAVGAPAPSEEDYRLLVTETKTLIKLTFTESEVGQVGYFCAAFGNPRGTGPLSDPIQAVVS